MLKNQQEHPKKYKHHMLMQIGHVSISRSVACVFPRPFLLRLAIVSRILSPTSHATTSRSRRAYSDAGSSTFSSPAAAPAVGLGS